MPWTCPSCREQLRHDRKYAKPHFGVIYRCYVCRLNLVFNPKEQRLVASPPDHEEGRRAN